MPPLLRVVGYAIVSADGMIADASGHIPPALINEADQRFFYQGLDDADVIVHGRHSQEQDRNAPRRQRLVMTRQIPALAPHPGNPKALLWNPNGATLEEACEALGVGQGEVAIIGGTDVYGAFLARFDMFELTVAPRTMIPGGRPVFRGIPPATPESLLNEHGLRLTGVRVLDAAAEISLHSWSR